MNDEMNEILTILADAGDEMSPGEKKQLERLELLDNLAPWCNFDNKKIDSDCTETEKAARTFWHMLMAECSKWEEGTDRNA